MGSSNPFWVGGPVSSESFKGRDKSLIEAFDHVSKPGHLAVHGEAGVGKSSLLKLLSDPNAWRSRERDPSRCTIVYLDCTAAVRPFTRNRFWSEVLQRLREQVPALRSVIDPMVNQGSPGKSHPREVLDHLAGQKKRLLLLLDDYEPALLENPEYTTSEALDFLYEIRELGQRDGEKGLSTVVTSFRRLDVQGPKATNLPSPWYNLYMYVPLRGYAEAETKLLFDAFPQDRALTPEQRAAIQEIAGSHPALLQTACYLLYEPVLGQHTPADRLLNEFVSRTEQLFRRFWTASSSEEQMLLMLVALTQLNGRLDKRRSYKLTDVDLIFSQLDRQLKSLVNERGLLRQGEEQGRTTYLFDSSIMEWWVIKEIESSPSDAEIHQYQRVFGGLLSRKQVAHYQEIVKQVWQHKDAINSVVQWAGGLVRAFFKGIGGGKLDS